MTAEAGHGRIVVGYDGRWQSPAILEAAAAEAERLDRPLSIITLVLPPDEVASTTRGPSDHWHPHAQVRRTLEDAVRLIRQRHETLRMATSCLNYRDVQAHVEPFQSAALLVLGDHGNHGVPPFELDSASRLLRRAVHCPVLLVPHNVPESAGLRGT